MAATVPKLFVCYLHGLDRRRVNATDAPYIHGLLATRPTCDLDTLPTNELPSTVVSGVPPHVHGLWQVSRKAPGTGLADRTLAALPAWVSTTLQCFRHLAEPEYDLPAVERRRRRQFEIHRYKTKRLKNRAGLPDINGNTTIFGAVGAERSRLVFAKNFETMWKQLPALGTGDVAVEFYETYAYDLYQHWNLDREEAMREKTRELVRFVAAVAERCEANGVTMLVLSDHGQERVTRTHDLKRALRKLGVPRDEYLFYIEAQVARFWFDTDRARATVLGLLRSMEGVDVLGNDELHAHGIRFADATRGEVYAYTRHGTLFFPHDFYVPLANLFMAWTERTTMASRFRNPVQRGYHGHLHRHPAEEGFVILDHPRAQTLRPRMDLMDVAPTILSLIGTASPTTMKGTPAFAIRDAAAVRPAA